MATFALGCFWGKQYLFQHTPGVVSTRVGYTGGHTENPSYVEVCSKQTGHAEAVEVSYDPQVISYEQLLHIFFENHNPTSQERQGVDHSGNYRSAIFTHNEQQAQMAQALSQQLKEAGHNIVTQISPQGPFYEAEERHQGYCERTGNIPSAKNHPISFPIQ